jgi:hypothetical protein
MISSISRASRALCADPLFFAFLLGVVACEKGKPPAEEKTPPPEQAASASLPESSPEAAGEYARTHLPPGLKPGDFLTKKNDYPTGDTADVFRAVLDTLYIDSDSKPPLVVMLDLADARAVTCAVMPCPLVPPQHSTSIGESTLEAYRQATLTRRHIRPDFKYRLPLKLLTAKDRELVLEDGRFHAIARVQQSNVDHPFWVGFTADYPGAWGYAAMSSVGMNPEKTEAMLQVRHHCGGSCYSFETMIARKISGRWRIVERVPEQADSLDRGERFLRYRGVGAHRPMFEVRAAAVADSIKLDKMARDIHGVLTDPSGNPIVGVTITVAGDNDPNRPYARVTTDSRGAYRIDNPMVGGAAMMVRCPQSSGRPDGILAVTGAEVKPATSLQLNLPVEKNTCDEQEASPQTIQPPIDAGPFGTAADSARARRATYPSDEEAAVYRAVLANHIQPADDKVLLVYATTTSACSGPACADEYYRHIRFEPEIMLATMENFLATRQRRLDLRDGFTAFRNAVLLGDSAVKHVERATSRGNVMENWDLIHRAWPSVEQLVQLSPVAFSPHHRQAMVEIARLDKNTFSRSVLVANKQPDGSWIVVRFFYL